MARSFSRLNVYIGHIEMVYIHYLTMQLGAFQGGYLE
jgi:hypothetical protein